VQHGPVQHDHLKEGKGRVQFDDAYFTGMVAPKEGRERHESNLFKNFVRGVRKYSGQKVFLASVAYSSLWCTVLDNGTLMTAYLYSYQSDGKNAIDVSVIGSFRGAGAIFGLIGTVLFPRLLKMFGNSIEKAGLVSLWLFWLLLVPGLIALAAVGQSTTSVYIVMISMAVSRIGLWSFDLAETQIMQEYIVEEERGTVNSMQTALYQAFYVFIQFGGIIFHKPQQFVVLIVFSVIMVFSACCLYTFWYQKNRGRRN